ncbi:HCP-like protein [Gigaspora margarita]|uniref:HCP-like protein n=1 Tax=Gigaspora margarita TaxID=4874 RepID=A0A8H4AEN4_GIGMA|nr:HCP-like protein [Gigaspora margarita]
MNQENPFALYNLRYNYEKGINLNKDEKKAFELYLKAANMGHTIAIFDVARCYDNGIGVEMDEHKAFIYYQKSAEMGHWGVR